MLTAKRLYLYAVLAITLALVLVGFNDLTRLLLGGLADLFRNRPVAGGGTREQLSWALALILVAGPIWVVHLALVRRTLRGDPVSAADERACASRSTYFFVVLGATAVIGAAQLFEILETLVAWASFGERPRGLVDPLAAFIVVSAAWVTHLWARRSDLRRAPERTSGDWLTRLYLYGALYLAAVLGSLALAGVFAAVAQQLIDVRQVWESAGWWREAIVGPLAGTIVAAAAWATHWWLASRLLASPDPMGRAHRTSNVRRGSFLAVVVTCATAVLVLGATGLYRLTAEVLGTWQETEDSRLIEDIGGPLIMTIPFLLAWWWHLRRATSEALLVGGPELRAATVRTGRLLVAFVGLAGLSAGLALELHALVDAIGTGGRGGLLTAPALRDAATGALPLALMGLAFWLPSWARSQRERSRDPVVSATATSRRSYLLLVSALAVIAGTGALAFLIYQALRQLLDVGDLGDTSWAISVLLTVIPVLGYHLWQLRADMRVVAAAPQAAPPTVPPGDVATSVEPTSRARQTLVISAPAGADFRDFDAAVRAQLPDGYELQVVES